MIAIIIATVQEAAALLTRLDARAQPDRSLETYAFDTADDRPAGVVVISGIGKAPAAAATTWAVNTCGAAGIVNVGVCGALSDQVEHGRPLHVTTVVDADADGPPIPCSPGPWTELPGVRLATVDEPVFGDARRGPLLRRAEIVDMEGAAVARACAENAVPVHLIKAATDRADATGKADIQRHLQPVCERLADAVVAELGAIKTRRSTAGVLARFVKIEHSVFSLPLLMAGAFVGAGGTLPPLWTLAMIIVAGVAARTLGMAANRLFDRKLDAMNPRTAGRELPSGRLSPIAAALIALVALAVFISAAAALGRICLLLSPIPAACMIGYALLKRVTSLCHFGIGLCMALGPIGAYVAASGGLAFSAPAAALGIFAFCWISGFDIIYAMQDIDTDRAVGVHSLPAALGPRAAESIAAGVHVLAAAAVVTLWWLAGHGLWPTVAAVVAILGLAMAYLRCFSLRARFFPISVVSGIAGATIIMLGGSI